MAEQEKNMEENSQQTPDEENPENIEERAEEIEQEIEEEADEIAEEEAKGSWADKRAAKKQAKQDKKADAYREQIEKLEDKVKRQLAEFENFRNRTEREKTAMFETGAKSVIEKMLPVIDNFERGLATLSDEEKEQPFAQGMDKIYKQFVASLEELGVKAIEAEGNEFDPNFHNAVMHVEDEQYGENIVAEELLKGYMYRDSVVRHSMVKVAN